LSLTPELQAAITERVAVGNYVDVAAGSLGVPRSTLRSWMQRGKSEEEGPYRELLDAVTRARDEAEVMFVTLLARCAKGGQTASAAVEWLKRTRGERWYTGPDVAVQVNNVTITEAAGQVATELQAVVADVGRDLAREIRQSLNGEGNNPAVRAALERLEGLQAEVTRRMAARLTGGNDDGGPVLDVPKGGR
jgi:hypothetical protein